MTRARDPVVRRELLGLTSTCSAKHGLRGQVCPPGQPGATTAARGDQVPARRREAWSDDDDGRQVADPVEVAGFAGEVRADRAGDDVRDPQQGIRRARLVIHAQLSIQASLSA